MRAIVSGVLLIFSAQSVAQDCSAEEVVEGFKAYYVYNLLVCSGIEKAEQGEYHEAAMIFERALRIPFHESPNFSLFPRLALTYHMGGEEEKARVALRKAELSLFLIAGIARCRETEKGYALEVNGVKVSGRAAEFVKWGMCGSAYDRAYVREGLEDLKFEARLLDRYMAARAQIMQE